MCRDAELFPGLESQGKTSMKDLFGVAQLRKDGTEGKVGTAQSDGRLPRATLSALHVHVCKPQLTARFGVTMTGVQVRKVPAPELLQENEGLRTQWIDYSAKDAEATLRLFYRLQDELRCSLLPVQRLALATGHHRTCVIAPSL